MTAHRLAKPQHKHTRKSFWGTISERSIAVLLKRSHANERSADTCAATDAAGSRTFVVALRMSALPPKADIRRCCALSFRGLQALPTTWPDKVGQLCFRYCIGSLQSDAREQ